MGWNCTVLAWNLSRAEKREGEGEEKETGKGGWELVGRKKGGKIKEQEKRELAFVKQR